MDDSICTGIGRLVEEIVDAHFPEEREAFRLGGMDEVRQTLNRRGRTRPKLSAEEQYGLGPGLELSLKFVDIILTVAGLVFKYRELKKRPELDALAKEWQTELVTRFDIDEQKAAQISQAFSSQLRPLL